MKIRSTRIPDVLSSVYRTGGSIKVMLGLEPVIGEKPEVLILGSMPGQRSLEQEQYYAHPRNAFWWIMNQHFSIPLDLQYEKKCEALKYNRVALWDVLSSCQRKGSLDSSIEKGSEQPNKIESLLLKNQSIQTIAFNGRAAQNYFRRFFGTEGFAGQFAEKISRLVLLPSTSPAYATISKEQKYDLWKEALPKKVRAEQYG